MVSAFDAGGRLVPQNAIGQNASRTAFRGCMIFDRLRSAFNGADRAKRAAADEPAAPPPRLLGLSMVKNEQDVIEPFLRHHAALLDTIVLLDNASIDRTRAIALDCARELGNVVIGDSPEFSFLQSERTTRLLQAAQAAFRADYVFFLDADEFLSAPDRDTLLAALRPIPPEGAGLLQWRTFVIRPGQEDAVAADPPVRFTHRRLAEQPPFGKVVLRLDSATATGLTIAQGSHTATREGVEIPAVALDPLHLQHFPVRSSRQIAAKAVVGWTACVARDPGARGQNMCFQWRDAFDCLATGGQDAIKRELAEISFRYAQERSILEWDGELVEDTPAASTVRRYSDGSFADPLGLIACSWERSLAPDAGVPGLDRLAPIRFVAELRAPSRVLVIGKDAGPLSALFDGLGIPCVTAAGWREVEGSFDLAIQLDDHGPDRRAESAAPFRVMLLGDPAILESAVADWVRQGFAVDANDTGGARALAADAVQRASLVVLRRHMAGAGVELT